MEMNGHLDVEYPGGETLNANFETLIFSLDDNDFGKEGNVSNKCDVLYDLDANISN